MAKKKDVNFDSQITFRISKEMKQEFIDMCEGQNQRYQVVLRNMIKNFIKLPTMNEETKKRYEYLKTEKLL